MKSSIVSVSILILTLITAPNLRASQLDSLINVQRKYELSAKKPDTTLAKIYNEIALRYLIEAKPDSSLKFSQKASQIAKNKKWLYGEGIANKYIGSSYQLFGKYQLAIQYSLKALYLFERLKDESQQADLLRRIADSYSLLYQTQTAYEYYEKARKLYVKQNRIPGEAICLHNMGNNFRRGGEYEKAIEYYKISLPKYLTFSPVIGLADTYEEMAISYGKLRRFQESEYYFLKAKEISDPTDNASFKVHLLSFFSEMYIEAKQYNNAIKYGKEAFALATQLNLNEYILQTSEVLYRAYKAKKATTEALIFHEKMMEVRNEISDSNKKRELESLKFEYENQKQKELTQSQQEALNLRTNQLYLLGIVVTLFIAFAFFLYRNNNILSKKNAQIEQQKNELTISKVNLEQLNHTLEERVVNRTVELQDANERLIQKNREIEGALFKGQSIERKRVASELHDNLGGQISAIRWSLMAIEKENLSDREKKIYENVMKMMNNTYTEIRNISHNLLPEAFEKHGLVPALKTLLLQLNQSEKIKFELVIDNYKPLEKKIEFEIYSIILELVTNVLKHSQATKAFIKIIRNEEERVNRFSVSDNGVGFDVNAAYQGKGMKTIIERVERVKGVFFTESVQGKSNFCVALHNLTVIPRLDNM